MGTLVTIRAIGTKGTTGNFEAAATATGLGIRVAIRAAIGTIGTIGTKEP